MDLNKQLEFRLYTLKKIDFRRWTWGDWVIATIVVVGLFFLISNVAVFLVIVLGFMAGLWLLSADLPVLFGGQRI